MSLAQRCGLAFTLTFNNLQVAFKVSFRITEGNLEGNLEVEKDGTTTVSCSRQHAVPFLFMLPLPNDGYEPNQTNHIITYLPTFENFHWEILRGMAFLDNIKRVKIFCLKFSWVRFATKTEQKIKYFNSIFHCV